MTVLHVVSNLNLASGGPVTALAGLIQAQKQAGLEVSVACGPTRERQRLTEQIGNWNIPVHELPGHNRPLQRDLKLRRALQSSMRGADILHLHDVWENIQAEASIAARESKTPVIFRTCGMLDRYQLVQKPVKKWLYLRLRLLRELNSATAIHYSTHTERDLTHPPLDLRSRAIIEPNGITLTDFQNRPAPGFLRARFPAIGTRPIVLFLGRLHPKKGLPLLLEASKHSQNLGAVLVIIGSGTAGYEAHLRALTAKFAGGNEVFWGGLWPRADCLKALRDADLFVLPSYQENFGNAVVEAMAMGIPCVVSAGVALASEVEREGAGSICQTDARDVAAHLARWICDPAARLLAGEKARIYALEHFNWDYIAARWNAHYAEMIGTKTLGAKTLEG